MRNQSTMSNTIDPIAQYSKYLTNRECPLTYSKVCSPQPNMPTGKICSAFYKKNPLVFYAFFFILLLFPHASHATKYIHAHDSLYFFYQRTTYLENVLVPGAWWSNPALTSLIDKSTILTTHTGPLGGLYTLASVRFIWPVFSDIIGGIGLTGGSGGVQNRSLNATQGGAEYSSNFSFSRPSFEINLAMALPLDFKIGMIQSLGSEVQPVSPTENQYTFAWGNGLGLLSPMFFKMISISASTFSIAHFVDETVWEHNAKLGLLGQSPDERIKAGIEYCFSLNDRTSIFSLDNDYGYSVMKGLLSYRFYGILGLLAGYSVDTNIGTANGSSIHGGLEVRKSPHYPFFGGYEMGISTVNRWSIIHRVWFAYGFNKKEK